MILDNGLKIMSIDATDLFRVEVESTKNKKGKEIKVAKEIVPSGLSSYYDYYDESKDEILHLRNPQLFKMKLDSSMALDELGRVIAGRRMTKTAFFNVRRKLATDQVVYLTFKYSSFRSTLKDDKDDKGKVKKYRVDGKTKETIRYMIYDKEDFSFKIDDIEYVRWCRSGSASRQGKCFFINKELVHSMNLFTDCGINPKKRRINLASFEAYRALLLSHKTANLDIRPENILLIKDVKSVFKDKVMYVGLKDKKLFTEEKKMTIENKIWDGQSLIDKSLMGDYQDKGMLLLRHKFFKSCCFNSNIQQWFKDNHITDVSQLNGITTAKRIEDIKFITTPSSIKYCKFGDTENWFYDWLKQISKKNIPFGIVKYEKPTKYFGGKLVRTHYQILNTLQITKNKITELLQQTLDYIELLRKDPLAMYHYCEATSDDEDSDLMMNVKADVIYRMMKLNMSFKDTALYKILAKKVIESIRADIKCGRILVNGNYSTVLGNPIEMLQESIGKYEPETTIVGKGNIISTAFPQKQLLACRSPHITIGNIYLPQNTENHLVTTYINMTDNIIVINSVGENVLQRANSMDFDSDQMMIVDNDIMIDAAVKNYDKFLVPTTDIEPDPKEEEYTATDNSVGLPIHYHNFNDEDYNFGVALLNDIKPIMDALEDVMAKMSDSIYVNVMNPMPVAIGQRIESSIPADAVGYVMNLDVGDFKYANCSLDYNSIKLYLDNMKQFLNDVACMPSVLGSSTNIANISEVSMQILLMMASVYADENKKWLNIGFQKRFEMFKKILGMQGIKVNSDVEVIYNVAMPVASTEMIANLKALQEMGAISKETIMEKTEYVSDVEVEKKRLSGESTSSQNGEMVDNPSNTVGNK